MNKTIRFSFSMANRKKQTMLFCGLFMDLYQETQIHSEICVEVVKSAIFSTSTQFLLS